ncbi:MAG: ankyrin repeat domain-containing protein [Bacteroidetes bacterium]|nr:ankyrin repeat domain-containing protein [Bacteroidota bacterium]
MFSARYGFTEITELLAKAGAKIDIASDGITPLMAASIHGHPKTVEKLIELGADVNLLINGNDAFQFALYNKRSEVMKILINNGALLNRKNENGVLPLQMAIYKNLNTVGKLLLSKGADPNLTTVIPSATDLLAKAGPDEKKEISNLIEAQEGNKKAIEKLKSGTVEMSSLMVATQHGNIEMVKALLDNGANIHFKNTIGGTALAYSRTFKQKEIENLLIRAGAVE